MRKLLVVKFLLFFIWINSANSQTTDLIVIKAEDLEIISVSRLSDIFSIIPQLDLYTLDGYRYHPVKAELFDNSPQNVTILINGVKTSFGVWDKTNLSQFPIHPNFIDSIIIQSSANLYEGEFFSGILIDIITKELPEDISFIWTYVTGNETGDPGPYRYTEHFSDNVDQFGPNTYISSSYSKKSFNLTLNFLDQVAPATDPAILKRIKNFNFQNYQVRYSGFSISASAISELSDHNFYGAFTKTGQAVVGYEYGADLFFVDEISTEIPYQSNTFLFSSGNEFKIDDKNKLNFDFNLNNTVVDNSKLSDEIIFNSQDLWINSKILYSSSVNKLNYSIGSNLSYQTISSERSDFNYSRSISSVFGSINFNLLNNINTDFNIIYRTGIQSEGYFISLLNTAKINDYNQLYLKINTGNLTDINNSLSFRIYNGYSDLNFSGFEPVKANSKASKIDFKLGYLFTDSAKNSLSSEISIDKSSGLFTIVKDYVYDENERSINVLPLKVYESISGVISEFFLSYTHTFSKFVQQKISYKYKTVLSGDTVFEKILNRIPEHKIFYSIYYNPFKDLSGYFSIMYASEQIWYEYSNINSQSEDDGLYSNKLSSYFIVNCAITKRIWQERIRLSANVYNLLNNQIQHHPIGGRLALTFFLKAEVNLESILSF